MYLDFFNLSDEPFRVTPDPDFLYLANQYKEALAAIVYGIAKRKGFVCIIGEVGVGKTTILRSYLGGVESNGLHFVYIFNPKVAFPVLVRTILRDLGQPTDGDVSELVERLHEHLIECYRANRTVVLFVDEAQNMPVETLENLRMLSNLETTTDKLLQIVLVGQPELDAILSHPQLRQLRGRIVVWARLHPLTRAESLAYIRHRLGRVALDAKPVFTDAALERIAREAGGVPRQINILCDAALITGFGYRKRPIPPRVIREVVRDTLNRRPSRSLSWGMAAAVVAALAGIGAAGGWWVSRSDQAAAGEDAIGRLIRQAEGLPERASPVGSLLDWAGDVAGGLRSRLDSLTADAGEVRRAAAKRHAGTDPYGSLEESGEPGSDLLRVTQPQTQIQTQTLSAQTPSASGAVAPPLSEEPPAASSPPPPAAPGPPPPAVSAPVPPASSQPAGQATSLPPSPGPAEAAPMPPAALPTGAAPPAALPMPAFPPPVSRLAAAPPQSETGGGAVAGGPLPPAGRRSVTLRPGDTLSKLGRAIYGSADDETLRRILRSNPEITDSNKVFAGQVVTLPALPDASPHEQEAALRKER